VLQEGTGGKVGQSWFHVAEDKEINKNSKLNKIYWLYNTYIIFGSCRFSLLLTSANVCKASHPVDQVFEIQI